MPPGPLDPGLDNQIAIAWFSGETNFVERDFLARLGKSEMYYGLDPFHTKLADREGGSPVELTIERYRVGVFNVTMSLGSCPSKHLSSSFFANK